MQFNDTINNFLENKNINLHHYINNDTKGICYNKKEVNNIVSKYGMYNNKTWKKISVADIVGKDKGKTRNLLDELNELFDMTAESYKRRSVSMLEYSSKEIVSKLKQSFAKEPIELKEIKQGKYIVGNNGMHRVTLLRVHYIEELTGIQDRDKIRDIKEKYTIDVVVEELDKVKTYSRYLISLFDRNVTIEDEIDKKYLKTQNIIMYDEDGNNRILNHGQLIAYVKERINTILENGHKDELMRVYRTDEYFKEYVDMFLKEEINNYWA